MRVFHKSLKAPLTAAGYRIRLVILPIHRLDDCTSVGSLTRSRKLVLELGVTEARQIRDALNKELGDV